MKLLADADRQRVDRLVAQKREIHILATQNPSFTADLLRGELVKTDRLVEAFLDMAVTCARYEQYLESIDIAGLDKDRDRWDRAIRAGKDGEPQTEIAKKNLAVIMKRFEKVQRSDLRVACGQLDLIENSFRLLADQIVTMQSPQQLSGQLDELLTACRPSWTARDTERLLSSLGLASNGDSPMNEPRLLRPGPRPRRRYLRGEASMFILHGNVTTSSCTGRRPRASSTSDRRVSGHPREHRRHNMATGPRFAARRAPAVSTTCSARRTRTRCCRPSSACSWAPCAPP
jgi:hypothetical protein